MKIRHESRSKSPTLLSNKGTPDERQKAKERLKKGEVPAIRKKVDGMINARNAVSTTQAMKAKLNLVAQKKHDKLIRW